MLGCEWKTLGLTSYCTDWVVQPFCFSLSLGYFCQDTVDTVGTVGTVGTVVTVSGTASGGGNWRAKRNFCSTQSVNDSKSTRKISFARLPLVCLYFGVSCELDLCLVSLASAAVALLAILAVAVLQYCLQDSVLQCVSMAVILLLLLLEAFTDRWPILAHVHSFGHLVAI